MSGRKKIPKCSQPTKKKRRMKSKGDSPEEEPEMFTTNKEKATYEIEG